MLSLLLIVHVFPMKIPSVYLSSLPFRGCSRTCSSMACVWTLPFDLHPVLPERADVRPGPLSGLPALPSAQPHVPYFHFCFPGICGLVWGCLGFSLAHPHGPKMTRAADIQWLPGFMSGASSASLRWTLALPEAALPRAAEMPPSQKTSRDAAALS